MATTFVSDPLDSTVLSSYPRVGEHRAAILLHRGRQTRSQGGAKAPTQGEASELSDRSSYFYKLYLCP